MNLIDAIKSGKPFRLRNDSWIHIDDLKKFIIYGDNGFVYTKIFDANEILSEEWEIEEKKIELTRKQVLDIYHLGVLIEGGRMSPCGDKTHSGIEKKLKELGFE